MTLNFHGSNTYFPEQQIQRYYEHTLFHFVTLPGYYKTPMSGTVIPKYQFV